MDHDDARRTVRNTDPETSQMAAGEQAASNRAHEQRALRWFYDNDREAGWTQAEFNEATPDKFCGASYWRRLTTLRDAGWTVVVDTRVNPETNQPQMASRITDNGCEELGVPALPDLPPSAPKRAQPTAESVARAFHEAYEELAPAYGYETREASARPWEDVPTTNRALMIATVSRLIERDVIKVL